MATKPKRIKSAAALYVPQSKAEVASDIRKIGDLQREAVRLETLMNDEIAKITQQFSPEIEKIKNDLEVLSKGVQNWCESHRDELTENGKIKTANLVTGEVAWRNRPPSVSIRGVDSVLETLKRLKLDRFIRVKEEVNKEAILNEPKSVAGVAGISVKSGIEDFAITPFEQDAGI
ncbi:host-nuclease inhibitor Gam family protein [Edwardsiella anguillarum]|uniref:host-nuclease inhibitor Gam family protein n=1 Tax=Edwardsiella anguillarum TaxID=1821960 RepID=UPI0024B730B1|nr:host-nuclease inhibitor Gam family protein [Edwardsiella anguillarum]WHQ26767.1 host-nuclease inhibitor Gam family protein [Edwardsiella anguillarum]